MFQDMLDFDVESYQYIKETFAGVGQKIKEFCELETKLPPEGMQMGLEGELQVLPITAMGIIFTVMGVILGIDRLMGAALVVVGIADIFYSGYVYYDE